MTADASAWDARYGRGTRRDPSSAPNQFLREHAGRLMAGHALEFGCGEGTDARWLASRGWDVTAVDFSEVAVDRARSRAHTDGVEIHWHVEDLRQYRPEPCYDLAYMFYVHPAPPDRVRVLRSLVGAVRPGGHVLVVGRDRDDYGRGHGGPDHPDLYYTIEALADSLVGMTPLRCERVQRDRPPGQQAEPATDIVCWVRRPQPPRSRRSQAA